MSRLPSSSTSKIWAERMAKWRRSNLTPPKFCQSIDCSLTSFYQWKRKLSEPPEQSAFLRVHTSEPAKETIEIKLPSGVSIFIPVSAVESIYAILKQVS